MNVRLRGSIREQYTLAYRMAEKLWDMLGTQDYINSLGALSGGQAEQMVRAGLRSIYLSGWQVAGDANLSEQVEVRFCHDVAQLAQVADASFYHRLRDKFGKLAR